MPMKELGPEVFVSAIFVGAIFFMLQNSGVI